MRHIIYKITNLINQKVYIGAHSSPAKDSYMGSGKLLKRAIKKYGVENFKKEELYSFTTKEEMYTKERELVNADFVADTLTYNLKIGGEGGNPGLIGAFAGKTHTDATKAQISKSNTGKKMSESAKLKISKNNWSITNPEAQRQHAIKLGKKPKSASHRKALAKASSVPQLKTTCLHCNKIGGERAMKRWHFDNCINRL